MQRTNELSSNLSYYMNSTWIPEQREAAEGESLQVRAYTLLAHTYVQASAHIYLDFVSTILFHLHLTFDPRRVKALGLALGLEDKGGVNIQRHLNDN